MKANEAWELTKKARADRESQVTEKVEEALAQIHSAIRAAAGAEREACTFDMQNGWYEGRGLTYLGTSILDRLREEGYDITPQFGAATPWFVLAWRGE